MSTPERDPRPGGPGLARQGAPADGSEAPLLDLSRRFVRVTERRPNGFVVFDFALGEPELFAELLLPEAAFEEFCRTQSVEFLPPEDVPGTARLQEQQHYGQAD